MHIKKIIGRYFAVNMLMILSLALSYFILVNASSVITTILDADDDKYINQKIEFSILYNGPAIQYVDGGILFVDDLYKLDINALLNDLNIDKGILYISTGMFIGNSNTQRECSIIMSQNEEAESPYKYTKNGIVIGKDISGYCTEKNNNKVLTIENHQYNVSHVLPSSSADDYDIRILINYDLLQPDEKKAWTQGLYETCIKYKPGICCTLIGIDDDINETFEKLSEKLKSKYEVDILTDSYEEYVTVENDYKKISLYLLVSMYIFCILNNFVVARLWINIRKKEMAVRKAYGYTRSNIATLLIKELGAITIISFIISIIAECLYCAINEYSCITLNLLGQQLVFVLAGISIIMFIIISSSLNKIDKLTITDTLTERNSL